MSTNTVAANVKSFKESIGLETEQREILAHWPLYRSLKYEGPNRETLPTLIKNWCQNCRLTQLFEFKDFQGGSLGSHGRNHLGFTQSRYQCRNCQTYEYRFQTHWTLEANMKTQTYEGTFAKVGQWPTVEISIDPALSRALSGPTEAYFKNSKRCRDFNLGIAAVAYLRRVVEDKMNELLDRLVEERQDVWSREEQQQFEEAKASWQFSRKIDYAGDLLPTFLKPQGRNPLGALHDLASDGLHNCTESECIDIYDRCVTVLTFVFRQLQLHRESITAFETDLASLQRSGKVND